MKVAALVLLLAGVSAHAEINPVATRPQLEELKAAYGRLLQIRWDSSRPAPAQFGGAEETCVLSEPLGALCLGRHMSVAQVANLHGVLMPRLEPMRDALRAAAERSPGLETLLFVQVFSETSFRVQASWNWQRETQLVGYIGNAGIGVALQRLPGTRIYGLTEEAADHLIAAIPAHEPRYWSIGF